jgi:uncharacterized protein YcfL
MRKLTLLFAVVATFAMTACGNGSSTSTETNDSTATAVDTSAVTATDTTTAEIKSDSVVQ